MWPKSISGTTVSSDASRGGLFRCLTKAKRARLHPIGSSTDASAPALTHVSEKYTNQFLVNIGSIKVSEVIGDLYVILENHQQLENSWVPFSYLYFCFLWENNGGQFFGAKNGFWVTIFLENNKCQKIVGQPVLELETAAFLAFKSFSKGTIAQVSIFRSIKKRDKMSCHISNVFINDSFRFQIVKN